MICMSGHGAAGRREMQQDESAPRNLGFSRHYTPPEWSPLTNDYDLAVEITGPFGLVHDFHKTHLQRPASRSRPLDFLT